MSRITYPGVDRILGVQSIGQEVLLKRLRGQWELQRVPA